MRRLSSVFTEITKSAIQDAFSDPGEVNINA